MRSVKLTSNDRCLGSVSRMRFGEDGSLVDDSWRVCAAGEAGENGLLVVESGGCLRWKSLTGRTRSNKTCQNREAPNTDRYILFVPRNPAR